MRTPRGTPTAGPGGPQAPDTAALVPRWFLRTVAYAGGLLVLGAAVWAVVWMLLQVALVAFALLVALLLAALLAPLARVLRRWLPAWVAALLTVVALLAVVVGIGFLLVQRVMGQLGNLTGSLTTGIDQVRGWLIDGPLALQPRQINQVADRIVSGVESAAPDGFTAASMVISALSGVAIVLFVLYFLFKDGPRLWGWVVETVPAQHRDRVGEAGRRAWETMSQYTVGVVVIALTDAVLIGAGLFALGVPLALSLAALVFLGGFVPFLGAFLSGAVAALVTLVTNDLVAALIVVGIVLVVQNLEGNLLQPLVQGHQVRLHPVVILAAVSVGFLVYGIGGAVVAVPVVAVAYRVGSYLRNGDEPGGAAGGSGSDPGGAVTG
ncbi:AI-2E family transporter [Pseudonocardia sp.]|uniref:AI-2E family transporter n=1 Tax=Pseudonocardia sp. TaxID=60912 RepID=UPI00261E01B0|nr:AI-2E family transporter [Pseudonocardia sp.]